MSNVYKCTCCGLIFGNHPQLPKLTNIDPAKITRYLDSSIWRCPNCNVWHDTRDIQPFLGTSGYGTLKQLKDHEIEELINPKLRFEQYEFDCRYK